MRNTASPAIIDMEIDKLKTSVVQKREFKGGKILTLRTPAADDNH
jgi:hypothetical protein